MFRNEKRLLRKMPTKIKNFLTDQFSKSRVIKLLEKCIGSRGNRFGITKYQKLNVNCFDNYICKRYNVVNRILVKKYWNIRVTILLQSEFIR